uniref:Laminin EGF-like domain-containing protein n=1 Tax=Megaselia scalaris TaxID=36166 RepID=T1GDC8_MEGSC
MCDVVTGQCRCRENMSGRRCESPIQKHYIPFIPIIHEAEAPGTQCFGYMNHNCSRYEQNKDYMVIQSGSEVEFTVDDIPKTMTYDVQIKYMTQSPGQISDTYITLIRPETYEYSSESAICSPNEPQYEQRVPLNLPDNQRQVVALSDVCLEKGKTYRVRLHFERFRGPQDENSGVILVDSLNIIPKIIPENHVFPNEIFGKIYQERHCQYDSTDPTCADMNKHIALVIRNGSVSCDCDPTGSLSKQCEDYGGSCSCKPNVVGRTCNVCAVGTYGFGPDGCKACDCNSIGAKDNNCDVLTVSTWILEFPNCMICNCNGHTNNCDALTGECLNCEHSTTGFNCDSCLEGFYGDPSWASDIGCRPCRCPDTVASNHSHAVDCQLDRRNNNMQCICKEGYAGTKCEECADNYFGSPEIPGGSCELCDCNDNINPRDYGNCDAKTGTCLKCLYDTTGEHCEFCKDGFYGNALEKDCRPCECELLGTNSTIKYCDRFTGHCPCLPNVIGMTCDSCIENHWKIASGEGCEHCDCDPTGSLREQCNPYDGQCECRTGFGGRQCNQCQRDFWGDPNVECHACE